VLYITRSLDGTKPSTNPETSPKTNSNLNTNPIQLFYSFFRAPSHDLQISRLPIGSRLGLELDKTSSSYCIPGTIVMLTPYGYGRLELGLVLVSVVLPCAVWTWTGANFP